MIYISMYPFFVRQDQESIHRPISLTVHGSKSSYIIHFDYLYMGIGVGNMKYILVIREDLSSFVRLILTKSADAENNTTNIAQWIGVFKMMNTW